MLGLGLGLRVRARRVDIAIGWLSKILGRCTPKTDLLLIAATSSINK